MFDTLNVWFDVDGSPLQYEGCSGDFRHRYTKHISCYKLTGEPRGSYTHFTLCGSVARFVHGNNLTTATVEDVRSAMCKLSEEVGFPLLTAKVGMVDVAVDVAVNQPPEAYFKWLLGHGRGYARLEQGQTTLLYRKPTKAKVREFSFYNKVEEMRSAGMERNELTDNNLMRVEYRLRGGLSGTFFSSADCNSVENLLLPKNCDRLRRWMMREYQSINKQTTLYTMKQEPVNPTPKEMTEYAAALLKAMHPEEYNQMVFQTYGAAATRYNRSRMNSKDKELERLVEETGNPSIEELDCKVVEAIEGIK